ncbi:beta-glucoside-specific PTS transporter subunit IIABC [Neobacillus drentensis]|uniref:beta-glucoside-specific PTS transporter subunit IIABC n=1 Tax=Neobacillus drentensis TaxID=220684 RepID=UPI001F325AD2|nr:beta-glucoside-specific PTS transporter subunit IIABC [Neobacillus drentensis]ULT58229.1 beta-glucoside-specific PTS transporter subunit IIABC [Neobacillus drentensis]
MEFKNLAATILEKVGGKENISSVGHCVTRLRFNLKDSTKADTQTLKNMKGVVGVVDQGGQYQVVIGNNVQNVYKELVALGDFDDSSNNHEKEKEKGIISKVLDTIAGSFFPIIPALAGAGMLKAVLALLMAFKWVTVESQTYLFLNFMADAAFYFLPILLAASAAKKFKVNQFAAMAIGAILVHPTFITMTNAAKTAGTDLHFLGIPVPLVSYASSVIPVLLAIWFMSYVEPFVEKIIPNSIKTVIAPLFTLIVVAPTTLIVIGPLGNYLGLVLGMGVTFLNAHVSWLVPTLVGTFTPFLVMTGMHYGIIPIGMNMLATKGFDTVAGPGMMVSNIAEGAASLAVALRTKNSDIKQLASSAGITAVVGVTEPAMYGISLRFKRPLVATMIGGGVGGLFIGIMGVGRYAQVSPGIFSLPSYIGPGGFTNLIYAAIGCAIAFATSFIVSYILGIEDPVEESIANKTENKKGVISDKVIYSPLKGKAVELKEVDDAVFSEGILGKGVAIIPEEGKVFAPIDGTVTAFFDTHHAIGITGENGSEILIHVGIDTVKLGGRHYSPKVTKGQTVKKGDLILEFDIDAIKNEGYQVITPFIVTNSADYADILSITGKDVQPGEALLKLA